VRKLRFFSCLLLCILLSGCAHLPWRAPEEDNRTRGEEGIDPLAYPQDQVIVTDQPPPREMAKDKRLGKDRQIIFRESPQADSLLSHTVYRIQFFATKYPDEASRVAEMVSSLVSENTYIDYKAPYYWVRVGDCETKEEAEQLLRSIKQIGYEESWVVQVELEP
jgi:hypothetical protein